MGVDAIRSRILTIRGMQVMLASDLALLYNVPTKRLNEQVKRNIDRFPERFMFQLTAEDVADLRSQFATSKQSLRQVPRPLPRNRQDGAHPRGRVAEPSRQEVLRLLVNGQV